MRPSHRTALPHHHAVCAHGGEPGEQAPHRPQMFLASPTRTRGAEKKNQRTSLFNGSWTLGRRPRDLAKVLACMALGAPGVRALRALKRTMSAEAKNEAALRRSHWRPSRVVRLP